MTDSQKLDLIISKIERFNLLEKDIKNLETAINKIGSLEKDIKDLKTTASMLESKSIDLERKIS